MPLWDTVASSLQIHIFLSKLKNYLCFFSYLLTIETEDLILIGFLIHFSGLLSFRCDFLLITSHFSFENLLLIHLTNLLYSFDEHFEEVIYPKGDPDAISISKKDVELLQPETFINDTIIDFYIK